MVTTPRTRVFYSALMVSLCIPALLLTACQEANTDIPEAVPEEHITEQGGILHPLPQFIPHYDNKHVSVDGARATEKLEDVPGQITLLAEYLDDPASKEVQALGVDVSKSARDFRVELVGKSRLVMLGTVPADGLNNRFLDYKERLVEYNLATGEHVSLDTLGGGPRGSNATDMAYHDKVLYVQNHGWRVARFDCAAFPCTFGSSLSFGRGLDSVAPVTSSRLAVLGPGPITKKRRPPSELYQNVVRVFDLKERKAKFEEGSEILTFGSAYDAQIYKFNRGFMNNARLVYSRDAGRYALTYTPFPHIYVYNKEGQLAASYRFDDEIEPVVEYRPDKKGRSKYNYLERDPKRSYFLLTQAQGLALVLRESIAGASRGEDGSRYTYDYYAVDLQHEEVYRVGTSAYVGQHAKIIYPTEAGLVVNEGGELFFIEK